jgi:hypothetical protein
MTDTRVYARTGAHTNTSLKSKIADEKVGTKCCASSSRDYSNLSEVRNCVKCAELKIQLQQVRDELSSDQLIIQMLNKEHVREGTSTQQTEAEREEDKSWKMITIRGPKRGTEGNMKLTEKKLINSKEQAVLTASRFAALETDSNSPRNEYRMKTIQGNKLRAINNDQKEKSEVYWTGLLIY